MRKIVVTLAAITLIAVAFTAERATNAKSTQGATLEVRVVAMAHEDGRVEFGIQYDDERFLPTGRFLSPELAQARRNQWLSSTSVEIVGPALLPAVLSGGDEYRDVNNLWESRGFGRSVELLYVQAKSHSNGSIEFALVHNGERLLPDARYLPPALRDARAGEWLRSTPVEIEAQLTAAERVRSYSTAIYDSLHQTKLPADIARECVLTTVTVPDDAMQYQLRGIIWDDNSGVQRELEETGSAYTQHIESRGATIESRRSIVTLFANENPWTGNEYRPEPAPRYMMFVEIPRHPTTPSSAQWLAVEFVCGDSEGTDQRNVAPPDDGGGQLE